MPGACCLKKIDGKSTCTIAYSEYYCVNIFNGTYLGDYSYCPNSGYCNVSPEGIVDDCAWCCGCKRSSDEPQKQYYPCCFEDRNKDGICDCVESHDPEYDIVCSGYAKNESCSPVNFGYTDPTKRSSFLGGDTSKEVPIECSVDVRIPRACCFMEYSDTNIPIGITCQNVCNSRECDLKNTTSGSALPAVYSSGAICNKKMTTTQEDDYECRDTVDVIIGGGTAFRSKSIQNKINKFGACFSLNKNGKSFSYSCTPSSKTDCNHYFVPIAESGLELCFSDYAPQNPVINERGLVEVETMNFTSFLNLGLKFGDYFRGAYFIGIYSPETSSVYGSEMNDFSKKQVLQKSKQDVIGVSRNKSWALFVDNEDLVTKMFKPTESNKKLPKTSSHNGYYNCYGDSEFGGIDNILVNTLNKATRKGLLGWYIPSIQEMMFLSSKLVGNAENTYTYITKMKGTSGLFTSSTNINSNILYSQFLDLSNGNYFGKVLGTSTVGKIDMVFKLFKRIELTL